MRLDRSRRRARFDAPQWSSRCAARHIALEMSAVSSRGTKYWSSGAIPLIEPDVLGDIIATAADIAIVHIATWARS